MERVPRASSRRTDVSAAGLPGRAALLLLVAVLPAACTGAPDRSADEGEPLPDEGGPARTVAAADLEPVPRAPLFREVTETHLPTADLEGLSMDAAVGDLDGDGDPDVVIANEHRPNILLLNEGRGHFRNASDRIPQVAHDSEDVGIADFDGDGDLDVIVVSEDDRVNELYLNRGDARFEAAGDRLPVTGTSNAVVTTDLNGDSVPDVLIGNNGQNVALVNDGDARFRDETGERLPRILDVTQDLEMGDVDGDGDLDLIVGNEDDNRLLVNDGSGVFTDETAERIPLREAPEETREADFGDVDGDGDLDLLFANVSAFVEDADPRNRLLVNRGDGHYRDETGERLPAHRDRSFDGDFIDVDGDGDLDIVTSNSEVDLEEGRIEDAPYRVYLNEGGGLYRTATDEVFPDGVVGTGFDVEATDVDGDGRLDLYLASRGSVDRLLLGLGPGEQGRVARGRPE
ncbi:MAG: VCBS repeat-containing protein [Candidatus Palauibacterales bacterium]|nr:VCBS repeat-containing protein [Candidatus Palauibacterales bacterium]